MFWPDCNIYLVHTYTHVYNILGSNDLFAWSLVPEGVSSQLINIYGCHLIGGRGDNIIVV